MLQDDRVMSILTGLVIVVAMATLAQRSDKLADFFFGEKEASIAPQNDSTALFAGDSQIIDVLANDENAKPEDAGNLHILVSPSCGAAEATDGGVLYISNDRCVGAQLFAYCVRRGDECASASVTVNVAAAVETQNAATLSPSDTQQQLRNQIQRQNNQQATAPTRAQTPAPTTTATRPSTVVVAKPEIDPVRAADPSATTGDDATGPAREATAAIRTIAPSASVAPRLGTPTPVLDDGGRAPVTQAEVAPKEEAGIFQRLFSAPSDEPATPEIEALDAPPRVAGLGDGEQWRPSAAPDVSQIAPQAEPELEIAAVQTETGATTRERARAVEAGNLPATPANTATPAAAGCAPLISSRSGQGGTTRIDVEAGCYAGRPFVLLHAGMEFGGRVSDLGNAEMEIPVLEISEEISARFDDGVIVSAPLNFEIRSVEQTHHVAIAWTAPVNLDLHAFEYSAGFGADGHVWEQNPRDFRDVRRPGGGFHTSYPAAVIDGQSIEVYTFWANRRARPGFMRIAVDHASRGEIANGDFCGQGPLATPGYLVVRAARGVVTDRSRSGFAPASCGQNISIDARYGNGALADLKITE